jgi:hypothetical protein
MTDERHLMICTDGNGTQSLFECTVEGCGRRLVLDHVNGRRTILHPGATWALHSGSTGLVALSGALQPGLPRVS